MNNSAQGPSPEACPSWCVRHHEVSPDYWVHCGSNLVATSDQGEPLAVAFAVIGTYADESFGPQVDLQVMPPAPEADADALTARARLSPAETRRLAAVLAESAGLLASFDA